MTRAIVRTDPTETFLPFSNFGRLFDDMFGRNLLRGDDGDRLLAPALDLVEDEHAVTVTAELPGLKKQDVAIQFEHGVLTISGEKKQETETKDKQWHRMERRYGAFYRAITMPTGVEVDKAEATFADGVLTVRVPKREEVKPRAIKIK